MSDELKRDMVAAVSALASPSSQASRAVSSDLSIDETLLLHGMGYEPVDLVTGISITSIPYGTFFLPTGQGSPVELSRARDAATGAFKRAAERLRAECARANGVGVVGVEVDVKVTGATVDVSLIGTAVAPVARAKTPLGRPFVTDLSVQDFALLARTGWEPLDLVAGAGFVASPLQGMRQTLSQVGQNIELPVITKALQIARERAMDDMQTAAIGLGAGGVVDVKISDGPLGHSRHVFAFICYGTAIHLGTRTHQRIEPELVLPLDDNVGFEAASVH